MPDDTGIAASSCKFYKLHMLIG